MMVSNTVLAARDVFSPDDNDSIPDLETSAYTQTPLKKLKVLTALHQSYMTSPAIWDHTVLPALPPDTSERTPP